MTDPRRNPDPRYVEEADPDPPHRRRDPRRALAWLVLGAVAVAIVILALLVAPPGGAAGGVQSQPTAGLSLPRVLPGRLSAPERAVGVTAEPVADDGRTVARSTEPVPAADGEQQSDGGAVSSDDTVSGKASYVAPSYGRLYLALPEGPGHRVTICAKRCVTRWSTDAGPDRAMQRAGRVADLSFADFGFICRCWPPSLGLVRVTVQRGGGPAVTLPPTSTAP